ncbi:MAG: PqqD family protein [Alistipes sp.]|nr:PqqD family protein [Alistipes sp.]
MKLKEGFITHEMDGEQIMVSDGSTSFSGLVRSNKTAAFIVECLKDDVTEDEIVKKMTEKYDAPEERISADLKKILSTLRSIGAINE